MEAILWSLGLGALLIGSFTDIRTREVPDWISYGLMFAAGAARGIIALAYNDFQIFWEGALGFGVFVALAYLMFYAGQWGGGDSKLLMGLGAVIGLKISWASSLLGFWVNLLLVGSVYGLVFSIFLAIKKRKSFAKEWRARIKTMQTMRLVALLVSIAIAATTLFIPDFIQRILLLLIASFVIGGVYLFAFIKTVEKSCMLKHVKAKELTEGDWIVNDVVVDGKRITGPKDLGIEKEQIQKLIAFAKKGKINKILIKEGIPFVPSFLIAFILQWSWGSLLLLLV